MASDEKVLKASDDECNSHASSNLVLVLYYTLWRFVLLEGLERKQMKIEGYL